MSNKPKWSVELHGECPFPDRYDVIEVAADLQPSGPSGGGGVDPRPALFVLDGFTAITGTADVPFALTASDQSDAGEAPGWIVANGDGDLAVVEDGLYQVNWFYEVYLTADSEVVGQFEAGLAGGSNLVPVVTAPPFPIQAGGYVELGVSGSWVSQLTADQVLSSSCRFTLLAGSLSSGNSASGTNRAAISITKLV